MMDTNDQIASPNRAAIDAAENVYHTVQRAFPEAVADFESKWTAFQAVCHSLLASASPGDCIRTDEFETLRKQGPKVLTFVVFKLATNVDQNSHGAFLFNALVNGPQNRGVLDDDLTSKEALQRYGSQIVELSFKRNKVYEKRVKIWKELCEENRVKLSRAMCCVGDEYWDLLEVGPAFIPQLMVEYSRDRGGYWYELLHDIVHGRTTEAYAIFERDKWFDVWRAFLNGIEYEHAPKYIPNEWDIYYTTGKLGPQQLKHVPLKAWKTAFLTLDRCIFETIWVWTSFAVGRLNTSSEAILIPGSDEVIPAGAYGVWNSTELNFGPELCPNPRKFDPMRSTEGRREFEKELYGFFG
ncbi:hypothetical protein MY4824_007906 [Beauveria thailandica]